MLRMSTHPINELLRLWARPELSADQAIGHLIQHVALLTQRVNELEKHVRQLEAAVPGIKEPLPRTSPTLQTSMLIQHE
jgi:hypothetical protein